MRLLAFLSLCSVSLFSSLCAVTIATIFMANNDYQKHLFTLLMSYYKFL